MSDSKNNNKDDFGHGRVRKLKRTWDFICVSNDGKVLHFSKISTKVKSFAFISFLIFIYCCAMTYLYMNERNELALLTTKFIGIETNLQDVSRERDEMAAKMALAEKNSKEIIVKPVEIEKSGKNQKSEDASPEKTDVEKNSNSNESVSQDFLDIADFSAKRGKGSSVNLRFQLKAKNDVQKTNKGYIVSALMPSSDSPAASWKLSAGELNKGVPANPEKGQFYSFKGEKEVTIRLKAGDASKAVKIFVFDEKNKIVIDEVYQIEEAPKREKKKSRRK